MLARTMAVSILVLGSIYYCSLFGQQKPPDPPSPASGVAAIWEFPVILQQGVTAGKTPVGSKIQAKLGVSTLVDAQSSRETPSLGER
jgi:hypothetical protein